MAITILLIIINVAIFYFFNMQLSDVDLFEFFTVYGLNQYTVSNPLNWLTSMFLHGGAAHIAMNMIVLYQCGAMLESSMNKMMYLLLYLICGIAGSFAAVLFINNVDINVNVVGASGAIFGLLAYFSVVGRSFLTFLVEAGIFHAVVYYFHLPIAWYAHLGGAIMGLILALIFASGNQEKQTNGVF